MRCKIFTLLASLLASVSLPAEEPVVPSVVIGGGVGGGTAAIYLARAHFQPVVFEGSKPGGALAQSEGVENWPGILKIRGAELMEQIRAQAIAVGADVREEEVVSVDFSNRPFKIVTRKVDDPTELKTYYAASCVIATGSKPNYLGVKGEEKYWGEGVSNCAICDGSLYRNKHVGIVGGGDSAVLEALYLSNIAKKVDLFVRKDFLRATDEARKTALLEQPNIEIHFNTEVEEIVGNDDGVTGVVLKDQGFFPLDGLFLAIGSTPNTALFQSQIELDAAGYIVLKEGQETSLPFVYAVGDAVDALDRQAVTAAGAGARAALAIQSKLSAQAPALIAAYREQKAMEKIIAERGEAAIIEISSVAQFEKELESGSPLVVDFYATWCGPCKRIAPMLEASAKELSGKYKFLKVNVDTMQELMRDYRIRAMPTVVLINDRGGVQEKKVGEQEIGELLSHLKADFK